MELCSVRKQPKNSLSSRCLFKMSLSYAADDFLGFSADVKTLVLISSSNNSASFTGSLILPPRSLRDGGKMTEVANL